jgi:hypothetical protein
MPKARVISPLAVQLAMMAAKCDPLSEWLIDGRDSECEWVII